MTGPTPMAVSLGQLGSSTLFPVFMPGGCSGQAEWIDSSDNWGISVMANADFDTGAPLGSGSISISRYGHEPPLEADTSGCAVTVTEVSAAGLVGRAECKGLRWLNGYDAATRPEAVSPLPEFPAFDATVTFEARP